ncbi:MAG TPA: phage holin family protein [Kofleriaceae bacterium]
MNPSVEHRDEQPAELITGVLHDARELALAEVDKIKAEAIYEVKEVGAQVKVVSLAVVMFGIAAIMLATSLSLVLVEVGVPAWAGFGIMAVVFSGIGYVFIEKRSALAKAHEAAKQTAKAKHDALVHQNGH